MSSWICIFYPRSLIWAGGLYISSVDFSCFSTKYGDCEALEEREIQVTFTLFLCLHINNLKCNKMNDIVTKMIADQEALRRRIDEIAKANNLSSEKLLPIYDGVEDISAYLKSEPKIMWILKEPYDYINEETKEPEGGGWNIMDGINDPKEKVLTQTLPRTMQRVIYSTAGIIADVEYDNMDYYYQPDMYKYLFQIAYINLSKMPAGTRSGDMTEKYKIWKDLIFDQIKLYAPDVIIFGGTFQDMWQDLHINHEPLARGLVDIYKQDKRLLVHAYHPGMMCSTKQYVDTMTRMIRENLKSR